MPTPQRPPAAADDGALLDIQDVIALIRYGESWVYDAVRRGRFPAPVIRAHRGNRWLRGDVRAWIQDRTGARAPA